MKPSQRIFARAAHFCLLCTKREAQTGFLAMCASRCLPMHNVSESDGQHKVSPLEIQSPLKNWAKKPPHKERYDDD
jgi:hypothetical protein